MQVVFPGWAYSFVGWDQENYLAEADWQLQDNEACVSSNCEDAYSVKLVETSNSIFQSLKSGELITQKELDYFPYKYKKATNFRKMYLLPKINKR